MAGPEGKAPPHAARIKVKLLLSAVLLAAPVLIAGRKFGTARALGALGVSLILTGAAGMASPLGDTLYIKAALGVSLLAWAVWIQRSPDNWSSFMDTLMGKPLTSSLVLILFYTVVPFGNLE